MKSGNHPVLEKARLDRSRAEKCRDLANMVRNTKAIAILQDYAQELETRACELERQALRRSA